MVKSDQIYTRLSRKKMYLPLSIHKTLCELQFSPLDKAVALGCCDFQVIS